MENSDAKTNEQMMKEFSNMAVFNMTAEMRGMKPLDFYEIMLRDAAIAAGALYLN